MAALAGERVGVLGAAGLSVHSFLDGLGIGFAFGVDSATGLLVFAAVVSHDFADGLNTVSYVLRRSGSRKTAVRWLTIDALAPLLGAIVGSLVAISDHDLGYVLSTVGSSSTSAPVIYCPRRTPRLPGCGSVSRLLALR